MTTDTNTNVVSSDYAAELANDFGIIDARTVRVTPKVDTSAKGVAAAERAARARLLADRASVAFDMRSDITMAESEFAKGNLRDYFELGTVVSGSVRDKLAKGARTVAINAEHSPEEWDAIVADAKARGVKPQPHRLSVYNRAYKIAELVAESDLHDTVDRFCGEGNRTEYSPKAFVSWLENREPVVRTPSDRFAAAVRSAHKNGLTRADMLAIIDAELG